MISTIFKSVLRICALIVGLTAAWLFYGDITNDAPSVVFGQFWFMLAPTSLQVAEAVISRYIDPCGLIMALGCSPFLWHPVIASVLQLPAALVMGVFTLILILITGLFSAGVKRRNADLHRAGR